MTSGSTSATGSHSEDLATGDQHAIIVRIEVELADERLTIVISGHLALTQGARQTGHGHRADRRASV